MPSGLEALGDFMQKTVLLGMGNPIAGDDAVGLTVVRLVADRLGDIPDWLTIRTSCRGGMELLELLAGFEQAMIVDSVHIPGTPPGRVVSMRMDDIRGSPRLLGVHDMPLDAVLEMGCVCGLSMPVDVRLFAVTVDDVWTFRESLSPAVSDSAEQLADLLTGWIRSPSPAVRGVGGYR